jgi:4-hydroxybenzoate polyprenyltransferase
VVSIKETPAYDLCRDANGPIPIDAGIPLCVDLDGSLIHSDSLVEGLLRAFQKHPLACLKACFSLFRGRARFKRRIAELAPIDVGLLPYRSDLLALLSAETLAGRRLILATAADELVARPIAEFLGIFDRVICSDGATNCKGKEKLRAIERVTNQFLYVGDSAEDLCIWRESAGAIVAGGNRKLAESIRQSGTPIYAQFPSHTSWRTIARAIRVHQWPKNLLVLLPIFLGHRVTDVGVWISGLLAMAAFCAAASLAYVINDLTDLEADRQHEHKKSRPFASAELSLFAGLAIMACLLAAGSTLTLYLPVAGRLWIAAYFVATLLYSLSLKTRLLTDVVALALLYSIRVMAGGAATNITISPWTLAFCLFVFYSLALGKRFGELRALPDDRSGAPRRGYQKTDLPVVATAGVASGVLSVVVFALYISSPEVKIHYAAPAWLWLACPVILHWFGRFWILANRGAVTEDPIVFTLKDGASYWAAGCIGLVWLAASVMR